MGVPISASENARREWCTAALEKAVPHDILSHEKMCPRLALAILKGSHVPRGKYLAETLPPAVNGQGLTLFDEDVFRKRLNNMDN